FTHPSATLRVRITAGPLGSRARSLHACVGSTTPRGRAALAFSHGALLPSDLPDIVGFPEFGDFGAHNFGIPSLHVPLPNASSAPFVFAVPSHGSRSGWFA